MLEMVTLDLKDLPSSLKLLICDPENLLDFVLSRVICDRNVHSLKLKSESSRFRELYGDCSMVEAINELELNSGSNFETLHFCFFFFPLFFLLLTWYFLLLINA